MTFIKNKNYTSFLWLLFLSFLWTCQPSNAPIEPMGFTLIPSEISGIKFENHVDENEQNYVAQFNYVYNGGGVAIGDINQDGLADIYFTGNEVLNKLYLNQGNLTFKDITGTAGVDGGSGWHNGVNMIDINHDGLLDIYICRGGWKDTDAERANLLYINNGDLTFSEKAAEYGLADIGYSLQATFLDIDNDDDLDMYLTNRPDLFYLTPEEVKTGEASNNDLTRDKLYLNENNHFKEMGLAAGIKNNYGYGLGVVAADVNKDGYTDIYVTNDYQQHDYFYLNQKDGTFKESIKTATNHTSFYSMGLDIMDVNNDGWEDILTLDMLPEDYVRSKTTMASMNVTAYQDLIKDGYHHQYMHNMLQLNQGNGFFSEIGQLAGISKTDWSWSCLSSDFDNDGHKDIFISNGYRRDVTDKDATLKFQDYITNENLEEKTAQENIEYILNLYQSTQLENYLFQNNGNLTYQNKAQAWGLTDKSFSNGAATGDLDNDGDLDLVINNLESTAFLYENKASQAGNNFLKIKLNGPKKNPFGLGAKVTIQYNDQQQYQELKTTRGYLSSVEPLLHFGMGQVDKIVLIEVRWKDGKVSKLNNQPVNQTIEIDYNTANKQQPHTLNIQPILVDKTNQRFLEPFLHRENEFDDYKNQVLLPHQFSALGPFVTVGDINGDGFADFYVGGAAGQAGRIYTQSAEGTFQVWPTQSFVSDAIYEDMGAVFFDVDQDNDLDLYVASGGHEWKAGSKNYQDRLYVNQGNGSFLKSKELSLVNSSAACVIAYDYDEDGDEDLFVGGRVLPNKYPYPPKSFLLENRDGKLVNVTDIIAPELSRVGMVTSAVWVDLNQDKNKELVVVGEWMPITVFGWEDGLLKNKTDQFGFAKTSGWWNKVVAVDYDADGDKDLVIGNLGKNYKFKANQEKPFYVFANDFDENGTNDIFLAKQYANQLVPIRGKECSSQQMPSLKKKFTSYEQFAKAELPDILGDNIKQALKYEAHQFASVLVENQQDSFVINELPTAAQFSTINGIIAHDFNQDMAVDILVAGNNFSVEIETTRSDASPGQLLIQNEEEWSSPLPNESGFFVPKDVKDLQLIPLADGKMGVLVTTNNGLLRLLVR